MAQSLLLGLGGTGSRIINYVAGDLKKKNIRVNDGQISCAVIDTNGNDQEKLAKTGVGIPVLATSKDRLIETYMEIYEDQGVNDWMPISAQLEKESMLDGASQMRPKSRLAFYDTIKDGTIRELEAEVDKLFDDREGGKIRVMIVSSLAGGTGAGMFIQTAMWVRKYFEKKNCSVTVRGILVLPDVFIRTVSQIGRDESECRSLRANAYGAIRELNAITKMKTKGLKPSNPVVLEEVGYSSEDEHDGQPVFNYAFFMDDVSASGSALRNIVDYEKAVARLVYMQLFAPMHDDMYSEEDNLFKKFQLSDEPLYGSCGTAKAAYPAESILEYCSLRAARAALSTGWRKIDQNIKAILKSEKENEEDGSERTDPRKEYIRQFEDLSKMKDGEDKLLYKIKNDVMNATIELDGDKGKTVLTDKISDFLTAFDEKLEKALEAKNPGNLSDIKISQPMDAWIVDESKLNSIEEVKKFVINKREEVEDFIKAMDINSNRMASALANSVCPIDMGEVNRKDPNSLIGLFTKKDENGQTFFIHPIAVRCLLYKLLHEFEEKRKCGGQLEALRNKLSLNKTTQKYEAEIEQFDKAKTDEEEDALSYLNKKPMLMSESKFIRQHKELYYEFNANQYTACCGYAEKYLTYKVATLICERLETLIKIVEGFFNGLDKVYSELDDSIEKNVNETEDKGQKIFYICGAKEEKESLYDSINFRTGDSNKDVNKIIVDAFYAQLCVKTNPDADYNKQYADMNIIEIFKKEVVKTYGEIIRADYSDEIYLDLYSAVCKSSDLAFKRENGDSEEDSTSRNNRRVKAMKDLVDKVKKNSAPYLLVKDNVKSDLDKTMTFWGFSPDLAKACPELGKILGVNVASQQNKAYDKCELDCYCAVYGIPAGDVDKFNELKKKESDNFYGSYERVINLMIDGIAKGNDEILVQTPHLDKTWHAILPYITPEMQERTDRVFYRSFWFAIAYGMISIDKKGYYQITRTKKSSVGSYEEKENLKYKGMLIAKPEVGKLLEVLRTDNAFLKDAEKYENEFRQECENIVNYEDTLFLRGRVIKDTAVTEDGEQVKNVIGGVGSASDINALTLIVRYYNNPKRSEEVTSNLVAMLENLCKELVKGKYLDDEEGKVENVAFKLCKRIYDACQMSGKDIARIDHWKAAWSK